MASAIRHTELFDFPAYNEAIKEAKAASTDFGKAMSLVINRLSVQQKELLRAFDGYVAVLKALNVNAAGAATTLKSYNTQINSTKGQLTELQAIERGLASVRDLNKASVRELKAELKGLEAQYVALKPDQAGYADEVERIKKRLRETTDMVKTFTQTLKGGKEVVIHAEGSYKRLQQELTLLRNRLKEMPGAFNEFTGKLNQNNKEAVALDTRIKQLDSTLKKADASMGVYNRNVGNYASAFKGMAGGIKSIGISLLATAGLASISQIINDSIKEFLEADLAARKLENTLRNLGREDVIPRINKHIKELQEQFSFLDNEDISATFQTLITYGKLSEEQIRALIPVIIDFSAQTGQSLSEATSSIIKALEGNSKGMKEFGISMKDAKTPAEALTLIMEQLAPKVRGAGDAFGKSAAGQIKSATQTIKDFKEEAGRDLTNILAGAINWLNKARDSFQEFAGIDGPWNNFGKGKLYGTASASATVGKDRSKEQLGLGDINKPFKSGTGKDPVEEFKKVIKAQQDAIEKSADQEIKTNELLLAKKLINEEQFQGRKFSIISDSIDKQIELETRLGKNADQGKFTDLNIKKQQAEIEFTKFVADEEKKRSDNVKKAIEEDLKNYKKFIDDEEKEMEDRTKKMNEEIDKAFKHELKIEEDRFELMKARGDLTFQQEIQHLERIKRIKKKYNKEMSDEEIQIAEIKEARKEKIVQESIAKLQELFSAYQGLLSAQSEARVSKLEEEKQRELVNAGNNAAAKERIEKEFNKKIAKEKEKQAKADKAFAIFNILINTAQAVTKMLANPGGFAGIALSIAAGVIGAIQIAAVASRPLPKFKEGTKNAPSGLAIAGEGGYELIERDGQMYVTRNEPSIIHLEGGEKIYPHEQSKKIIEQAMKAHEMKQMAQSIFVQGRLSDQLRKGKELEQLKLMAQSGFSQQGIEKAFKNAVKEIPINQTIMDERGIIKRQKKMNEITTYLNNRHGL